MALAAGAALAVRHQDALEVESRACSEPADLASTPWRELLKKEKVLGKGGFGKATLYSLRPPCEGEAVVKEITQCEEEMVQREVSLHYRLRHPNILQLFDHFPRTVACAKQAPMRLLLEPAYAGHLQQATFMHLGEWKGRIAGWFSERSRMEAKSKLMLMVLVDTLRGLEHMHSMGILHRDVKPDNILGASREEGCVAETSCRFVLGDLGVATDLGGKGYTESIAGSPAFSPKEAMLGSEPDPAWGFVGAQYFMTFKSDIWSLGMSVHDVFLTCGEKEDGYYLKWESWIDRQRGCVHAKKHVPAKVRTLLWDMTDEVWSKRPTAREALERAEDILKEYYNGAQLPLERNISVPQCLRDCTELGCAGACARPRAGGLARVKQCLFEV